MLAERPELSAMIGGAWNVLTAGGDSGWSCRDGDGAGSCRMARRGIDKLPGVEAMLEGSHGATEAAWVVRTTWRLFAEKAEVDVELEAVVVAGQC